jgi:hypothetical protein
MKEQLITFKELVLAIETVLDELQENYESMENFLDYCNSNPDSFVIIEK